VLQSATDQPWRIDRLIAASTTDRIHPMIIYTVSISEQNVRELVGGCQPCPPSPPSPPFSWPPNEDGETGRHSRGRGSNLGPVSKGRIFFFIYSPINGDAGLISSLQVWVWFSPYSISISSSSSLTFISRKTGLQQFTIYLKKNTMISYTGWRHNHTFISRFRLPFNVFLAVLNLEVTCTATLILSFFLCDVKCWYKS
jgi:hypothetical protein